jgi:ABC-type uncharacterized transport system ATPase subunit
MREQARPASAGNTMALAVRDLRMRYGTKDVLTGVTFSAQRGEVLGLLGPNGAGKTTTIEILEGFRMPSAGEVSVLGIDPARDNEAWRSRIGVVLQSWRDHGQWRVRSGDPTGFVRDLLAKDEDVTELEVRRASLEDTYMALVQRAEAGPSRFARQPDAEQQEGTGEASEAQA